MLEGDKEYNSRVKAVNKCKKILDSLGVKLYVIQSPVKYLSNSCKIWGSYNCVTASDLHEAELHNVSYGRKSGGGYDNIDVYLVGGLRGKGNRRHFSLSEIEEVYRG